MSRLRIATRGSDLALAQARHITARIADELGAETELVVLRTTGDRIQDRSLAKIGGKGLFVKEIEEALLDGRADLAVHSAKDVPARIAGGCELAAYPERVDPRDALVGRERGVRLEALAPGARVGTGSTRRVALLRRRRPDLEIVPLRGNVPTRLAKIESEGLDAVVLACAGLDRLDLGHRIDERISPELMLPAIGQGLLALETRSGDPLAERLRALEEPEVGAVARAERAYQARLGGDCSVPLAGFAERVGEGELRFRGLVASLDGKEIAEAERSATMSDASALGAGVAEAVLAAGGREILEALAAEAGETPDG
ncbi:MAG: hydroxymethylbilane synthase [Deltaproteobacteria bacterium]|nr:hydroxymethylbilane synthase [Deltaproteobacteria bacterium]